MNGSSFGLILGGVFAAAGLAVFAEFRKQTRYTIQARRKLQYMPASIVGVVLLGLVSSFLIVGGVFIIAIALGADL